MNSPNAHFDPLQSWVKTNSKANLNNCIEFSLVIGVILAWMWMCVYVYVCAWIRVQRSVWFGQRKEKDLKALYNAQSKRKWADWKNIRTLNFLHFFALELRCRDIRLFDSADLAHHIWFAVCSTCFNMHGIGRAHWAILIFHSFCSPFGDPSIR